MCEQPTLVGAFYAPHELSEFGFLYRAPGAMEADRAETGSLIANLIANNDAEFTVSCCSPKGFSCVGANGVTADDSGCVSSLS